jgi:DNA-binding NtrC family response regulator
MERLQRCRWEGNARELENVIERAIALCEGSEIGPEDLPLPEEEAGAATPERVGAGGEAGELLQQALARRLTLGELENLYIDQVLEHTGGNKVQAARILGINRRTIYRRGDRRMREAGREGPP